MGYVLDGDVQKAAVLPEVTGKEDELGVNWDAM